METPTTLQAAIEFFSDPDLCHQYMVEMRWPDGVVTCPTCNQPNPRYLANQRRFECRHKHPRVRTRVVPNVRKHHLHAEIAKNVPDGTTVYTDALMSYRDLGLYYEHKVIDHAEKYVDGQIHTNGLENYWSLLKRMIGGTY